MLNQQWKPNEEGHLHTQCQTKLKEFLDGAPAKDSLPQGNALLSAEDAGEIKFEMVLYECGGFNVCQ